MRLRKLGRGFIHLGLLSLASTSLSSQAISGELLHRVFPSPYVEAPVEPAPPNAGYYPTRWNRWDSEKSYLPGLRPAKGPPETATHTEELPQPDGGITLPPIDTPKPRASEPAPRPPATVPKPSEPAPLPRGGDLPPLPGATDPLRAPAPTGGDRAPLPRETPAEPGPDLALPPVAESPMSQPREEKPREPEAAPHPLDLPPPQELPKETLPDPQPQVPPQKLPESPNPPKEPTDNLFAPPPGSGDQKSNEGANLLDRPSIRTSRAQGQWVAVGVIPPPTKVAPHEIAPICDMEDAGAGCAACAAEQAPAPQPGRLPVDGEAIPLSSVHFRPSAGSVPAAPAGSAAALTVPRGDTSVRPVNWTVTVSESARPLPNPLRKR